MPPVRLSILVLFVRPQSFEEILKIYLEGKKTDTKLQIYVDDIRENPGFQCQFERGG